MPATHLTDIVEGIQDIDRLKTCDAVLSGYLGSAEQEAANQDAWFFCDPVMGHPEKKGGEHRGAQRRGISLQIRHARQRHHRPELAARQGYAARSVARHRRGL
nr:Glutathione S-transferase GstA [Candidatus Pantoea persica]